MKIFIGWDSREQVAYHVCAHSIIKRSSVPVSITPINLRNMPWFNRPWETQSTEFSFTRFLTPFLAGYEGQAVFMDADMLVRCDIAELVAECGQSKDVYVVKHDYTPKDESKFLGNKQTVYQKKNWSSVMVFNCWQNPCRRLTPESVAKESGAYLHQFGWTKEDRIGELPREYNHLVGEYEPNPDAKIVHYTLGTPCFRGYENQEYAQEWFAEFEDMNSHAD